MLVVTAQLVVAWWCRERYPRAGHGWLSEEKTVVLDLNLAAGTKMVAAFRTDQARMVVAQIAPPSLWGVMDMHVSLLVAPAVAPPLVHPPLVAAPVVATPLIAAPLALLVAFLAPPLVPPLALLAPLLVEDWGTLAPLSPPWPAWQYSGVAPLLG